MSENKEKRYVTEWSFSFDKLSEQISDFAKSVGVKGEEQVKTDHFEAPLGTAASARVRLDLTVGRSTVTPLADSANLIEADLTYVGEIDFNVGGETEKVVSLSQTRATADWFRNIFGWIGSGQELHWDIGLTPQIPIDLEIHNGVGQCQFDLSTLQLSALHINGGAGEIRATLPAGQYPVRIDSGVGQTNLTIPSGAVIELNMGAGTGEINLDIGADTDVTARIRGGVGAVNVRLAETTAARVEYSPGLGGAHVNSRLYRVKGGDGWNQGGIWQTSDYDTADHKVYIRFDGGVGGLNVR